MRFNGCGCKACKTIAVSAASLFFANYVYPTAYGDECWHRPQVRLYCQSVLLEQPHSHHSDQRPPNEQRPITTTAPSTFVFVNNSNGVINFVNGSGGVIV